MIYKWQLKCSCINSDVRRSYIFPYMTMLQDVCQRCRMCANAAGYPVAVMMSKLSCTLKYNIDGIPHGCNQHASHRAQSLPHSVWFHFLLCHLHQSNHWWHRYQCACLCSVTRHQYINPHVHIQEHVSYRNHVGSIWTHVGSKSNHITTITW